MEKLIVICPNCKKKMKIKNQVAKYKCPNCSSIYKLNIFKKIHLNIKEFFLRIKYKITKKYNDTVATYKYMKQVQQHMKNNPNWSQYKKQQEEEKAYSQNYKKRSFKNFFKRK